MKKISKAVALSVLFLLSVIHSIAQDTSTYDTKWVPYRLKNDNYIFVDSATMKPISGKQWDDLNWFDKQTGFAPVMRKGKWGVVNRKEEFVMQPEWESAEIFDEMIWLKDDKKISVRNRQLQEILPRDLEIDNGEYYHGVIAVFKNTKGNYKMTALLNKQGRILIPYDQYDSFAGFLAKGFIGVKKNGKWGISDAGGKLLTPCIYDSMYLNENDNWILVAKDGKYGIIDSVNNVKVPFEYEDGFNFVNGFARMKKDGKWGFINRNNAVKIPFKYHDESDFYSGLATVKINREKYGIIDTLDHWVIPPEYDYLSIIQDNRIIYKEKVFKDRYAYGYLDGSGRKVIPAEYYKLQDFSEGLGLISKFSKWGYEEWGFIDTSGTIVIPLYRYAKLDFKDKFTNRIGGVPIETYLSSFKFGFSSCWRYYYHNGHVKRKKVLFYIDRAGRHYSD